MFPSITAWHFLPDDGCMANMGRKVKVVAGKTYSVRDELKLCANGLHYSKRAIDALRYAPGGIVELVEIPDGVERIEDNDKGCARRRKTLWIADASSTLHEFACRCAEEALLQERAAGREPDPRSWAAIEAKRAWLRGEIDGAAAWSVAWAAARAAARAASDAASDAAWSVAWAAAWETQNIELERRLMTLAP
jgi:hypothetical protein